MEEENSKNELFVQESMAVEHGKEDIKNLIYTIRGKQVTKQLQIWYKD